MAVGGNFFRNTFSFVKVKNLVATVAFFSTIILFSFLIIIMLNKFICPVKVKFKQLALGSVCSLFVIVLGTIFFALYLRFFNSYNVFYGSLASIIVFLLWANILMFGLALGVVVNSIYNKI
jgi:membrane protein